MIGHKDENVTTEKVRDAMKSTPAFALWPIVPFGGEGEGDNPDAGAGGTQQDPPGNAGNQGGQGNSGGAASGAAGETDDDDDEDEFKGYTAAELKRIAKDNAKKAKDAEADAKKYKDAQDAEERKKNDENTNLKKDVSDRDETISTLRATMTKQAIFGAIRDDTRYEWNDVEMVAQQLDPAVVKVDDSGRVEGIKASLPKVAKQHPFLVKKDNTDQGNGGTNNGNNNGGTQQNNGNNGPTGFQPGQGGTSGGGGNETDAKKLAENYPALAGRI